MARYSSPGEPGTGNDEVIYIQRPLPPYDDGFRRRLWGLITVVLISLCLLLGRTWQLQVLQGEYFLRLSEQNRLRSLRTKSLRGKILDRHGYVLADNRAAYTLMAIPVDLPPRDELVPLLRTLNIDIDPETLRPRRRAAALKPVPIQRDFPRDQVAYFAEHRMDFPGMFIEVEPLRTYPYSTLAAHLLGYLGEISEVQLQHSKDLGYYPGDLVGQSGLEQAFEDVLRGQPGLRQVEVDAVGRETQVIAARPATPGMDLVLTLDLQLQQLAERLLEGHSGSIVALDPRNGQILALASQPAFDPNAFVPRPSPATWRALSTDPHFPLHNRATQGQYPPGSVFKIVTALAALADGVITPQTTVCCPGYYDYGEHTFRDWKPSGHGCVQLRQALTQSCDVYFYHVGQLLGVDRIAHYAQAFGFGATHGFRGWLREERPGAFQPVETSCPRPTLVCWRNPLGGHWPGVYDDHPLAGGEYAGDPGEWGHPVQTLYCAAPGNAACPHTDGHGPHGAAPTPRATAVYCCGAARTVECRERPERHREDWRTMSRLPSPGKRALPRSCSSQNTMRHRVVRHICQNSIAIMPGSSPTHRLRHHALPSS